MLIYKKKTGSLYCKMWNIFQCIYQFISSHFRLYWPRSKSYDYLFSDGEALLRNFPVQATINFYEESDSEEEEDSCDEDDDSDVEECLKLNGHFTSYNWASAVSANATLRWGNVHKFNIDAG